jgi:hypothetical protein
MQLHYHYVYNYTINIIFSYFIISVRLDDISYTYPLITKILLLI